MLTREVVELPRVGVGALRFEDLVVAGVLRGSRPVLDVTLSARRDVVMRRDLRQTVHIALFMQQKV